MTEKLKKAWQLYMYFFRIGWYTFGGGWSIIAQMQKDFVERDKVMEPQELLDIVSVGRSLPGTMIGNVAYLYGYHQCGVIGGVLAVLGICTPPMVILTVITMCYTQVKDNVWVAKALAGVRCVVVPIILSAVIRLVKGAFPRRACFLLCLVGFVLCLFFNASCILVVLIGVAAGVLFYFTDRRAGA